jgi:hypothetical protein
VADYWAGMSLEETHEEDDDEADDPSPPTPSPMHQEEILLGDCQEHQLQAIFGVGKEKYPYKPCRVCAADIKRKETRYSCNTCKVPLHKGDCFTRYHTRTKC